MAKIDLKFLGVQNSEHRKCYIKCEHYDGVINILLECCFCLFYSPFFQDLFEPYTLILSVIRPENIFPHCGCC